MKERNNSQIGGVKYAESNSSFIRSVNYKKLHECYNSIKKSVDNFFKISLKFCYSFYLKINNNLQSAKLHKIIIFRLFLKTWRFLGEKSSEKISSGMAFKFNLNSTNFMDPLRFYVIPELDS